MTNPGIANLLSALVELGRHLLAVVAAWLPQRRWNDLWHLPIARMALPSALATAAAGMVLGARGFLAYVTTASEALAQRTLDVARAQATAPPGGADITTLTMQVVSVTAVFAFVLFTPLGWLTVYLTTSGVYRAIAASIGAPAGDPILTAVDGVVSRIRGRRRDLRQREARTRAEGPDAADRLFTGEGVGLSDADFVVVAARLKPEWTAGTIVTTPDGWFRLAEPFDAWLPFGLRRVYPLRRLETIEVLRRVVRYELPPLQRGPGGLMRTDASEPGSGTPPSAPASRAR